MGKKTDKAKMKKQRRMAAAADEKKKKMVVHDAMHNEDGSVVRTITASNLPCLVHCRMQFTGIVCRKTC
jgi:hypothetical protein